MSNNFKKVIIVESPAKARAIQSILGENYKVIATKGHILKSNLRSSHPLGINNYSISYVFRYRQQAEAIIDTAKEANYVYIATDPDREGETIAWHLTYLLKDCKPEVFRIVLDEITLDKLKQALEQPSKIKQEMVYAQLTRSVLDQLLGVKLTPVLTKMVPGTQGIGRIQSAALLLLRELEDNSSPVTKIPEIHHVLKFRAGLPAQGAFRIIEVYEHNSLVTDPDIQRKIIHQLTLKKISITSMSVRPVSGHSQYYLNTAGLLQEAIKRYNQSGRQVMRTAQELYEGIQGKDGAWLNLISYPRTTSQSIYNSTENAVHTYLASLGTETHCTGTQCSLFDEAIHPVLFTSCREPEALRPHLSRSQWDLYHLIWHWTLNTARYGSGITVTILTLNSGVYKLIVELVGKQGHLNAFQENRPDTGKYITILNDSIKTHSNPEKKTGHDEADLIELLEKNGIGRPSTYAEIVPKLLKRRYIEIVDQKIHLTRTGNQVSDVLKRHFSPSLNIGFTKAMEIDLDRIASGQACHKQVIAHFEEKLNDTIRHSQNINDFAGNNSDSRCPVCGKLLIKRHNREGIIFLCPEHNQFI